MIVKIPAMWSRNFLPRSQEDFHHAVKKIFYTWSRKFPPRGQEIFWHVIVKISTTWSRKFVYFRNAGLFAAIQQGQLTPEDQQQTRLTHRQHRTPGRSLQKVGNINPYRDNLTKLRRHKCNTVRWFIRYKKKLVCV